MKLKLKSLALLLTMVMVLGMFAGCSSAEKETGSTDSGSTKTEDKKSDNSKDAEAMDEVPEETTLKIMMFGDRPLHFDAVLDEFYARTADTLNIKLDIEFNPTADHKQKVLLIAAAGEEVDLIFDAPWMHIKTLTKDGAYQDLGPYFLNDDYPGLKANFSEDYLNANKFHDALYGMPITYTVASSEGIGIRKDMMDKYGYDEIRDYETLEMFFDDILENEADLVPMAAEGRVGFFRTMVPEYELDNIFQVGEFLVQLNPEHTEVLGLVHAPSGGYMGDAAQIDSFQAPWNTEAQWTEKFEKYADWSRFLEEDVLSQTDPKGMFAAGKAAALNRGYQESNTLAALNSILDEPTELYTFEFKETDRKQIPGQTYTTYQVWNFLCVPVTSEKIDRSMEFVNWIFESEENHDLFERGIEGVHWNKVGDDKYEVVEGLADPYVFPWYQLTGTPNMIRYNVDTPESAVNFLSWQSNPDKYVLSPLTGFNIDYENVKTEKASIDAIVLAANAGLVNGAYGDETVDILKMVNEDCVNAGLDTLREEILRQLNEFFANK